MGTPVLPSPARSRGGCMISGRFIVDSILTLYPPLLPSYQNASYIGLVNTLACPSDVVPYIFLGGIFSTVTNVDTMGNRTELVVNNVARFNVENKIFSALQSPTPLVNNTHIGVTKSCPPDDFDCDPTTQVAMVRSLRCASSGGVECGTLYMGGYFDKALGTPASGLAGVEMSAPNSFYDPNVFPCGNSTAGNSTPGVDGLVMTVESIEEKGEVVYGGIYDDEGDMPYLLNRYTIANKNNRCVVNRAWLGQRVCQVENPPLVCCELIFGPVYKSFRISETDLIVGGEFVNTLDLRTPDTQDIKNWIQPGYQNLAIVAATEDPMEDGSDFYSENLFGGPNGDVRDISCGEWIDDPLSSGAFRDGTRCGTIYVSGSFTSWLNYTLDTSTLEIQTSVRFYTPARMAKLVYDHTLMAYMPKEIFKNETEMPDLVSNVDDKSVNTIIYEKWSGELIYGGDFPSQNNLGRYKLASDPSLERDVLIPNQDYGPPKPDSEFYDCLIDNGVDVVEGANFCCRKGSFCPGGLVDISCPDGWGFYCKSDEIGICPEGYYCPGAGDKIICPKHSVCSMGSLKPRHCFFWEICPDEGLDRPYIVSGAILGVMILGLMVIILVGLVRIFSWRRDVGNLEQDRNFHLRYNAFKRNLGQTKKVPRNRLERRQSRYEGVEGWKDPRADSTHLKDVTSDSNADNLAQPLLGDTTPKEPTIPSGDASVTDSLASVGRRELKIDIGFTNLAVQLATGKKILNGVTGRLRAGRMTAIMGPSGCGKSTFLSALTNRIRDGGKTLGHITINGQSRPLLSIQHLVGFVPQEDIMHRDLTVRENLRFYAHLKGNPNMSRPQRRAFVNEVIDILGLAHVQHSLIGDEETRGISGGQRKRVNIGIELMSSPLVLFLDEPTSGLDSTMTQQLIDSLDKLAKLGLTIAMVIHQPRYEVLLKINDLLLLQKGGYPVYVGPTINALPYFTDFLGVPCPPRTTPADHFLDVISADPQLEHGNVCESWRWYIENTDGASGSIMVNPNEFVDRIVPARSRPSRFYQTSYFFKRSFYQTMNTKVAYFTDCVLLVFAGGMVGAVSVEEIQGYQLTMMTAGLIAVVSALKVFGPEKIVFMRETSAGVSTFAYFMGKALAHLWQIALNPIFFLGLYYRTAYPSVAFWDMYKVILMTQFSCSGLGYLISASVATKNMQIAGVITGLIAVLLSGLNPTVRSLQSFIVGRFGLWCSYGSWTMGALLIKQTLGVVKGLYPVYCGELDSLGYVDINNSTLVTDEAIEDSKSILEDKYIANLQHMFVQYAVFSFIAYVTMSFKAKNASGLMGLDALGYLIRIDFIDPFLSFLSTGHWTVEDLTPREEEERKSRLKRESLRSSTKGRSGGSGTAESASTMTKSTNDGPSNYADEEYSFMSGFTEATEPTANGSKKSIKWGDNKDVTINEDSIKEENLIINAHSYLALCKTMGKKQAKRLVCNKLKTLQEYENVGSVAGGIKTEIKFDIVKAALLNRGNNKI